MTLIRYLFLFMFVSVVSLLFVGYYNDLHPLLDSISHFRVHLLFMMIGITLFLTLLNRGIMRYVYLFILLVASFYTYRVTRPYSMQNISKTQKYIAIKHIQFNMNYRNKNVDTFKAFLKRQNPDIVTLQEVTKSHQAQLETLKEVYPYQRYCAFYPVVGAVAILSRYPFTDSTSICVQREGLLITEVQIETRKLTVASLHLHWPYPHEQYQQVKKLKSYLEKLASPVLLSGDFNAAPWSHIVQSITRDIDGKVVEGLRWSIELKQQLPYIPNMKLPIDHLMISKDLIVEKIEATEHFGSDHYAIVASLRLLLPK